VHGAARVPLHAQPHGQRHLSAEGTSANLSQV
jgi:hypothetical protein